MERAKEQLAVLAKLFGGCEEREDLQKAISAKSASNSKSEVGVRPPAPFFSLSEWE